MTFGVILTVMLLLKQIGDEFNKDINFSEVVQACDGFSSGILSIYMIIDIIRTKRCLKKHLQEKEQTEI